MASADHSYPATYSGTLAKGGTITLAVNDRGTSASVRYTDACRDEHFTGYSGTKSASISNHGTIQGIGISGSLDGKQASGSITAGSTFPCVSAWEASTNASPPECDDGIDNDSNGYTDHWQDDGCFAAWDPLELDVTPPSVPEILSPSADHPTAGNFGRGNLRFSYRKNVLDNDVVGFECALNDFNFTSCGNGSQDYLGLSEGTYFFRVRAVDDAGHVGPSAQRRIELDLTAPDTEITGGPEDGEHIQNRTPDFTFQAIPESDGSSFICAIRRDDLELVTRWACGSPAPFPSWETPLADGTYTFLAQAQDEPGNLDESPATRAFTVDTTPPGAAAAGRVFGLRKNGIIAVPVICPATEASACKGTLVLRTRNKFKLGGTRRAVPLGKAEFDAVAGTNSRAKIKVSKRAHRLLHKKKKARKISAVTTSVDWAGNSSSIIRAGRVRVSKR